MTTLWDIINAKLQREAKEAKRELATLEAKYERGEEQIWALVAKHRLKLDQTFEETLAVLREWSAQAAELQVFERTVVGVGGWWS